MKNNNLSSNSLTLETRDVFLNRHAYSLIAYTEKNRSFSLFLKTYIDIYLSGYSGGDFGPGDDFAASIVPVDDQKARERAIWLLSEIALEERESSASRILRTWHKTYEEPQDLVIGIIGLAIIGPTFGIINKKKKVDSMQILFSEEDMKRGSISSNINLAHSASMELISKSLEAVDGDFRRLEPDLQYWFVSDRSLRLGFIRKKTISDISKEMNKKGILHCYYKDANGMGAISISPSVRFDIYEDMNAESLE